MKSNNQALTLLNLSSNILQINPIKLEKNILSTLKPHSILKIDSKKLDGFILKDKTLLEARLFFYNNYFYTQNRKFKPKKSIKLKKDEFTLEIFYSAPFEIGRYILQKEALDCRLVSKYAILDARLFFKDKFFIEIKG